MSSSDNANKEDSSKQDETTPIVAQVLKNASSVEHNQIHNVSEVTEVSQDYDNVDDCMPQTQLKLHGIKRKYGDIQSQPFEQDTSLSLSDLNKKLVACTASQVNLKASTPTKKLFEKLFKDSPSAPASASTSNEVIDLTSTGDKKQLSMTKSVPEKMIDYPKT